MNIKKLVQISDNWTNPKTGVTTVMEPCLSYSKGRKLQFKSKKEAEDYIRWNNSPRQREYMIESHNNGKTNYVWHELFGPYWCNDCGSYHVTHNKELHEKKKDKVEFDPHSMSDEELERLNNL